MTTGELHERVVRLSAGLRRRGLRAGDRITVQLPNWTERRLLIAAATRIGVVPVTVMPGCRDDQVGDVLRQTGAVTAVTCGSRDGIDHTAMYLELLPDCPMVREVIGVRAPSRRGVLDFSVLECKGLLGDLMAETATGEATAHGATPTPPRAA